MVLIEMTDTFGGETNYSWVRRVETDDLPSFGDKRKLLKKVRELLEIEGTKLKLHSDCGDFLRYDVKGACVCIMISVQY